MVTRPSSVNSEHRLARLARERFVTVMEGGAGDFLAQVNRLLSERASSGIAGSISEIQLALETMRQLQVQGQAWVAAIRKGWRGALDGAGDAPPAAGKPGNFELVDDAILERRIVASRLASTVSEAAGEELNNLKLRIQYLEQSNDWSSQDVLRPDTLARELLKAWTDGGLTRPMWDLVQPAIQAALAKHMAGAYRAANQLLVEHGVMAQIDLKAMVRRDVRSGGGGGGGGRGSDGGAAAAPARRTDPDAPAPRMGGAPARYDRAIPPPLHTLPLHSGLSMHGHPTGYDPQTITPSVYQATLASVAHETIPPMTRIRARTQGVFGQLRRLLSTRVEGYVPGAPPPSTSPQLARELARPETPFAVTELIGHQENAGSPVMPTTSVQLIATRLRERATELKTKAGTLSEKAIIEIVALMFQAILAEERIPPAIRVWFARLQMPVLRLALAEPEFFALAQHPARQLIDRVGACALGFDAAQIEGSELEREVKRIVQVIEQYPETGRRVYELVLDEFKQFLGRSLTEDGTVKQAATLAQKVEQKEALSIRYTIELRRMLEPVPVNEAVREFLLRVWSEVLAMAAVRHGSQHAQTLRFKQAAADLLWAVSPRSERAERSRVVQQLAGLITVLREGMSTLAILDDEQDGHIKLINDAVMQAFASHAEGISQATLNELAQGLAGLEDVVTDDPEGDVLLDPGMIELMFDVRGGALEVISTGGTLPGRGTLQWVRELELGAWFELEREGTLSRVQYVWRSARGQLHLLTTRAGKSYLVQTRRLASYLQAGLLVPVEDEALTVRATRAALARLKAQPDQLLH